MLLTHHPLIFKAIKKVNDQNFITRRLVKLIQADISYYAMHTNFDAAPGCMADLAAERLSLKDTEPLECMGNMEINGNPVAYGIGKTGNLAGKLTVKALAEKVKQAFDLPFVLVYGEELMDMEIEKVALCPGAGGSVIEEAIHAGAKALVTGDISHHQGIDAAARDIAVIDAGHYGMEHIFIQYMAGYLKKTCHRMWRSLQLHLHGQLFFYNCCLCAADGQCPPGVQHAPVFVAEFLPVMPEFQRRMQRSLSEILV